MFAPSLQAAALTDVGKVRDHNEDAFGLRVDSGVFVVCDGMGGAAAGEVASRIAVDTLMERLCAVSSPNDRRSATREAITAANSLVYAQSQSRSALRGMGTTLVTVAIQENSALIAHVGDSRCYLFRSGCLQRQTNDHSLVDEQVRLGHITPEEAEQSPLKNVITRAIGTRPDVEADINVLPLESGDILLLCSDGLVREVPDSRIAEILGSAVSLGDQCRLLLEAANNAGSHDNVTIILVQAG